MEGGNQNAGPSSATSSSDFVRKLYKMLEDPTYEQVVRWGNDGNSFVVLENEKFTKAILPKHFKHSNFASFVRQLNKYDFHKVRHNNEESGQSPYGANAWEFKHPEFKMNGKDCLENIRRKAPAPRKPAQTVEDVGPPPQMDLFNSQLMAMQQQLQTLSDRYSDLSVHHAMLLNEVVGIQKSLVNHEQVMRNVVSYLQSAHSYIRISQQQQQHRAPGPGPGPGPGPSPGRMTGPYVAAADHSNNNAATPVALGMNSAVAAVAAVAVSSAAMSPVENSLPSPLRAAERILTEVGAESGMHQRNLEHINELYKQATNQLNPPSPESALPRNDQAVAGPAGAASGPAVVPGGVPEPMQLIDYAKLNTDLQDVVYPVGHNNGIDPMFGDHIHNIPYPLPTATAAAAAAAAVAAGAPAPVDPTDPRKALGERKKSTTIDPGWIRAPQILLVEDDPTCRRIGGKFLYSFKCAIDTALDGLEAVNKVSGGSKYDLVLMDIIMPNLDGVSACHLIRQFDTTPIIAMTSNIRSDDISMYFAHGMNDVLPKPFTKEGLLTVLEKHLGHLKNSRGMESTQFAQLIAQDPNQHSSKDDSSSAKSPSTANWQSPTQVAGISPKAHGLADEYVGMPARAAPPYVVDGGPPPPPPPPPPQDPFTFAQQEAVRVPVKVEPHRRQISQISDASAAEEQPTDAKRQRLYPSQPTEPVVGSSQPNRPGGWG